MSLIPKILKWKRNFVPEKISQCRDSNPGLSRERLPANRVGITRSNTKEIFLWRWKVSFSLKKQKLETCSDFVDVGSVNGSENRCLISDLSSFCASGTRNWERRGRGGGGGHRERVNLRGVGDVRDAASVSVDAVSRNPREKKSGERRSWAREKKSGENFSTTRFRRLRGHLSRLLFEVKGSATSWFSFTPSCRKLIHTLVVEIFELLTFVMSVI